MLVFVSLSEYCNTYIIYLSCCSMTQILSVFLIFSGWIKTKVCHFPFCLHHHLHGNILERVGHWHFVLLLNIEETWDLWSLYVSFSVLDMLVVSIFKSVYWNFYARNLDYHSNSSVRHRIITESMLLLTFTNQAFSTNI